MFGQTSRYFHERGLDVHTVELNDEYYTRNRIAFECTDIEAVHDDSAKFIRDYALRGLHDSIYYLDAHWNDRVPLSDELEVIMQLPKFVVVIHDVEVPGQPQFIPDTNVQMAWSKFNDSPGLHKVNIIYPVYNIVNYYPPNRLTSYVILVRGYPLIIDGNFLFLETIK